MKEKTNKNVSESLTCEALEDEKGQYTIHPITGRRIDKTKSMDQHKITYRPLKSQ